MQDEIQKALASLETAFSAAESVSAIAQVLYMVIGGALAIYLRWLYRFFGVSASDADVVTRTFPLLTIVATAVIAVVRSNMALSVGLLGALSIIRFRTAVKEPEELVYLFLCIAVGLSLGAEKPMLAVALVLVVTVFVAAMHWSMGKMRPQRFMLTVTGSATDYFSSDESGLLSTIGQITGGDCAIHRLDIEDGRGQARIMLPRTRNKEVEKLIAALRSRLPDCEFSFVDVNTPL